MTFPVVQLMSCWMGWIGEKRPYLLTDSVKPPSIPSILTWYCYLNFQISICPNVSPNASCIFSIPNLHLEWNGQCLTERDDFPSNRRTSLQSSYSYKPLFSADRNAEHNGMTAHLLQKDQRESVSSQMSTYLAKMLISVADLPQTLMPSMGQTG